MAHVKITETDLAEGKIIEAILNLRQIVNRTRNDQTALDKDKRKQGYSKDLILVNQYFNVPQVGELIRDLWLLNTLQENIEYHKQREEHMKNGDEKDMPMPQYPDD
jgi:hypothetical protein